MSPRSLGVSTILPGVVLWLTACATPQSAQMSAELLNGGFDARDGMSGWSQIGQQYGRAEVVNSPVVSGPGALRLTAGDRGSTGSTSLMVFQALDPSPWRGKRARFGAQVRTEGGGVNITLYTPAKSANQLVDNPRTGTFVTVRGELDVPSDAAMLSLGIQIFGAATARAIVDDVYVTAVQTTPPVAARVEIDAAAAGRPVPPQLFGMHVEWPALGNGLVRRDGTLRDDVVAALTPLRLPLLRFPGGIHADYYDWTQALGPVTQRAPQLNVFDNRREAPVFGTDEFGRLVQALGAQALITANAGTGTPEQAASWAQHLAGQRIPAPYWEVGNEIYLADSGTDRPNGRKIAKSPEAYAAQFAAFRRAITSVQPQAQVGLIAHVDTGAFPLAPAANQRWTERVLAALTAPAEFVAVHNAYAPVVVDDRMPMDDAAARERVYRALFAAPLDTKRNLERMVTLLDGQPLTRTASLAVTEWGPLFGYSSRQDMTAVYVDQSRTMAAALYSASLLNVLIGEPRVSMATYTNPIHKWYGSLLTDDDRGLVRTPSYHVFELYRTRLEQGVVPARVSGPTFDTPALGLVNAATGVQVLDATATVSKDGRRVAAILVNRGAAPLTTTVAVARFAVGAADCRVVAADAPHASNGPALTPTTVVRTIVPRDLACETREPLSIELPPYSVVSLVLQAR